MPKIKRSSSFDGTSAVINATNAIAFRFLQLLKKSRVQHSQSNNPIYSPLNITVNFIAVLNGASGETYDKLIQELELDAKTDPGNVKMKTLLKSCKQLLGKYQISTSDGQESLKFISRLLLSQSLGPSKKFKEDLSEYLSTSVDEVNLLLEYETMVNNNTWLYRESKAELVKFTDSPFSKSGLTALTAFCFKGFWEKEFKITETEVNTFYNNGEEGVQRPMMHLKDTFKYVEAKFDEDIVEVVEIPFVNSLTLVIFLPQRMKGIDSMLNLLDYETYTAVLQELEERKVDVYLPRFKAESQYKMCKGLNKIGIHSICTDAAQFNGITKQKIKLTELHHIGSMSIEEQGRKLNEQPSQILTQTASYAVEYRVDHPFVFFIQDPSTKIIAIAGIIDEL